MQIDEIVTALNQEISRLEQVRDLLANKAPGVQTVKRRGRPKGSTNKTSADAVRQEQVKARVKRQISEAGRARIAAAQKKRWAAVKENSERVSSSSKRSSVAKGPKQTERVSKAGALAKSIRSGPTSAKKSVPQKRAEAKSTKAESTPITE